nr:acyl-CoA dehydrogenase family protein [Actinomycetota bacterium]
MIFSDEHEQFRTTVRRYVEDKLNPRVPEWEAAEMMPLHDVFSEMAALGMLGLNYATEDGGQGADALF